MMAYTAEGCPTLRDPKSCTKAPGCPLVPSDGSSSFYTTTFVALAFKTSLPLPMNAWILCLDVGVEALVGVFKEAFEKGAEDCENSGQQYIDAKSKLLGTWNTPTLKRKLTEIITKSLCGTMGQILTEDSRD
ncbi:Chitinase 1 [Ceratocystis lukuohia]|uniref:Chitinase 1 n=1 Tax=Ceratocystis lukuohia TaxID=2019550 RepID=A0ABR4M932_9PEZI